MANPDKIIIINEIAFWIRGIDYSGSQNYAIDRAIEKFNDYIEETKKIAEFPEEIDDLIKTIRVYDI